MTEEKIVSMQEALKVYGNVNGNETLKVYKDRFEIVRIRNKQEVTAVYRYYNVKSVCADKFLKGDRIVVKLVDDNELFFFLGNASTEEYQELATLLAELKENAPTMEELGISEEQASQELKNNKEKSKSELGKKIGKFVSEYKNFKELTLANKIFHVVVPVILLLLVFSMGNGSGVDLSNFISTYNELSQESFEEYGITGWGEIEGDDLQEVQAEASLFINPSDITTYGYLYEGMVSNPGLLMLYADESDTVLGYTFVMSTEYIAGNDSFSNVVLESLMKSFDDLSDDEIYEIKSNFSMQDALIGVVTRDAYGRYEYNGITYVVTMSESGLNFSAYLSEEYAN